ncbi:hypothetical protein BpHYR1_052736 [Brachionus plicatilis]|uniref:Secreted protein n=1 Tax=Brachionus plicatilis TaxID=10195 RepID=A0A3M7PJ77_BRAPC|nr:hypothetical protein BpHYR1_052736 [Brachionus plicatilis]
MRISRPSFFFFFFCSCFVFQLASVDHVAQTFAFRLQKLATENCLTKFEFLKKFPTIGIYQLILLCIVDQSLKKTKIRKYPRRLEWSVLEFNQSNRSYLNLMIYIFEVPIFLKMN